GSLNLMIDIRESRASISKKGILKGSFSNNMLSNEHAKVFTPGNIPLPMIPSEFRLYLSLVPFATWLGNPPTFFPNNTPKRKTNT
ncbi:MAG: hypothetical protein KC592_02545, partial [Nitrospira sp.]|nr:hypothetical protein [Nitrospira sp.]